jgi:hypothetical protein
MRSAGRLARCAACGSTWVPAAPPREAAGRRSAAPPVVQRRPLIIEGEVVRSGRRAAPTPAPRPFTPPRELPRIPSAVAQARKRRTPRALVAGIALALMAGATMPLAAAIPGLAGLLSGRAAVVLDRVTSTRVFAGGEPALVVEGRLSNPSGREMPVPFVRLALRGEGDRETYSWTVEPAAMTLAPGASIGFRSALKNPVSGASRVVVSLVPREQRIGMR